MNKHLQKYIVYYLAIAVISVTSLCVGVAYQDMVWWADYKVDQNCKIIEHIKGSTAISYGYGMQPTGQYGYGQIVTVIPDKTAWLCDDGITYWR